MSSPLTKVLAALEPFNAKQEGDGWRASCPTLAHTNGNRKNPALSISEGSDGTILLHCHAGCETDLILDALGLEISDLFSKQGNQPPTARKPVKQPLKRLAVPPEGTNGVDQFPYKDASGKIIIYVKRIEGAVDAKTGKPSKTFRQYSNNGSGWIAGLGGFKAEKRPLFRLPIILENPGLPVVIFEGEKSVCAAIKAKLNGVHTSTIGGAGNSGKSDFTPLQNRDVFVCPDNDEPGRKHAGQVIKLCLDAGAKSASIVELPGLPPKGDICEWLDNGGTVEQFQELIDDAQIQDAKPTGHNILDDAIERLKSGDSGAHWKPDVIQEARHLMDDDRPAFQQIRAQIKAANPDAQITEWVKHIAETGQEKTRAKSSSSVIVEMVQEAGNLFHNSQGDCFISFVRGGHTETWNLESRGFNDWLGFQAFQKLGAVPGESVISSVLSTLRGVATFDAEEKEVFLRCAAVSKNEYLVDLCNAEWEAVKVTSTGWQIVANPEVSFIRSRTESALPLPTNAGDVDLLWQYVNIQSDDKDLILTFILDSWRPESSYPLLFLTGEQGSGKSSTHRHIRQISDANTIPLRAAPKTIEDIFVSAGMNHQCCFENMSHLSPEMQDALCVLATGGGYARRKLYTNSEEVVIEVKRPVILNGITDSITRPDLIDRMIHITVPRLDLQTDESELENNFEKDKSKIFGGLLDLFVEALKILSTVTTSDRIRMTGYALLGEAVTQVRGNMPGLFTNYYLENRTGSLIRALDASPVATALQEFVRRTPGQEWTGPLKTLKSILDESKPQGDSWPKSVRGLSEALHRMTPALAGVNICVERLGRKMDGYHVHVFFSQNLECQNDVHDVHKVHGNGQKHEHMNVMNVETAKKDTPKKHIPQIEPKPLARFYI